VFPVRYELNFYILFRINPVFKIFSQCSIFNSVSFRACARYAYSVTNINEYSNSLWQNRSNNRLGFILLYGRRSGAFSNAMNRHFSLFHFCSR
jgi:hypothetical protein